MLQLYKNIKNRRIELGMSQETLAGLTGYKDRSSIAKIEKGLVDLPQTKISLFASALNTNESDLLGWEDEVDDIDTDILAKISLDKDLMNHIGTILSLSAPDRKSVYDMIDFLAKKKGL